MDIDDRTAKALGADVMEQLRSLRFCIVGCGGTGAYFAEMLVRSGATRLTLIDGTTVEESNLNRVFSFSSCDVGVSKVETLKNRLHSIRNGLEICMLADSFREPEDIRKDYPIGQRVRDAVHDADAVFVGTDTNKSRLAIERLCRDKSGGMLLSCGVRVDRESGIFKFECNWAPETPARARGRRRIWPRECIVRVDHSRGYVCRILDAPQSLEVSKKQFQIVFQEIRCEFPAGQNRRERKVQ